MTLVEGSASINVTAKTIRRANGDLPGDYPLHMGGR